VSTRKTDSFEIHVLTHRLNLIIAYMHVVMSRVLFSTDLSKKHTSSSSHGM
jgi:hypothetical protein